ncbi:aldehyde dehydrogenase family protein [Pseudonocardia abyssalis]|uniref:Aldehyde dehydrogenase family protein n=1 Tax=Pseudonocardia abyssalis TaxID=2792008 RepID=A0ABS6URE0_9PSEU|nr:aldehyde dehydrogenase family protein [Pseudonocardia abyssalis]MBW0113729.1 aldehyde dehydrogenase family protein [Pseudonocardia abyssalis]MBW0134802.1 aldehyde dehydrogenase family protein [Pseudonocardia abyssalis]
MATPTAIKTPQLTINGRSCGSADSLSVIDPSTGESFIEVPAASLAQLDEAVAAANAAFPAWRATPLTRRQEIVRGIKDVILANIDELALLVTTEQGKPLGNARGEVGASLRQIDFLGSITLDPEVIKDDETGRVEVRREPLGVVGAITVWNYPILAAMFKLIPALVAGNVVIVKPSPYTPVSTMRLGELLQDVLPPGVFQVVAGTDELGSALTAHPGVHKISFTGSVATGKRVMASAAGTLKRVTLELGGNDAGIVLDDADPAVIGADLFWAAFSNSGQVCAALKRLYVPESKFDAICEAVAAEAATVLVGPGLQEGVKAGPVQNKPQLERVRQLTEDAIARGGEAFFTGEVPDGPGYWFPTTLVRHVAEGVPLVDEEPFGPVVPILTYRDVDDAVARANNTDYGLGASVWSPDLDRATAVAERLDAGSVWVNQHPVVTAAVPFGGAKQSGIGVEGSLHGLHGYTNIKVLSVKR